MFTYKSILTALFFSYFIYSNYLGIEVIFINTICAIMGLYLLFILNKKELFLSGFLISIFWFWWVGYSFAYYDLKYLIPLILLGIGLIYGILFYFIGYFNNIYYKVGYIFGLSFINPFGFNWFKLELPFINSYIGTSKIEYFIILLTIAFYIYYKDKSKVKSISVLFIVLVSLYIYNNFNKSTIEKPSIKITQYQTNIEQNKKWDRKYKQEIIKNNFLAINDAIIDKSDLIIMPETAFPLVLNKTHGINTKLLELSYDISIITGSLYQKDGLYYNSTYLYQKGRVEVAHKVVLVPFGEAIPLPEKIRNFINDIFYNGAKDYETAKEPTTFNVKGVKFRNAICYEATTDAVYKSLDTSYVIVTSNNAWFTPSIQPTLQLLLMKYYQKKYNLHYFNVTNE